MGGAARSLPERAPAGRLWVVEHIACDLCGADDTEPRLQQEQWTIVRCRKCGLVYLNPRPEPEVIERHFDWFRHAPIQSGARRSKENRVRSFLRKVRGKGLFRRTPREEVVLGRISEYSPSGRFLDVGCGDGFMVAAMNEAGYEGHGLDISDDAIEIAHQNGLDTVRKGTIHGSPYPDAHFDVILMMSVLEHEHYPTRALERARELLKPGGHIFIKVPHYGSWNRRALGKSWCGYYFPQHLFYFTPKTIGKLFDKTGLETVRNGFWDHVPLSDVLWATAKRA